MVVHAFHGLLVQHVRQGRNLVAQLSSLFKLQLLGMGQHALLQRLQHVLRLSAQKRSSAVQIALVVFGAHQVHTRPAAALDLIQQTGPRAVGIHRVFAGANAKHLLQQLNRLLDRPGIGVRAKVVVLAVYAAAVVAHARKRLLRGVGRQAQIGVAFVVPEQNIKTRVLRFNQVVLQQQGLGLRAHYRGL